MANLEHGPISFELLPGCPAGSKGMRLLPLSAFHKRGSLSTPIGHACYNTSLAPHKFSAFVPIMTAGEHVGTPGMMVVLTYPGSSDSSRETVAI